VSAAGPTFHGRRAIVFVFKQMCRKAPVAQRLLFRASMRSQTVVPASIELTGAMGSLFTIPGADGTAVDIAERIAQPPPDVPRLL
jgi:hypothetical protein